MNGTISEAILRGLTASAIMAIILFIIGMIL